MMTRITYSRSNVQKNVLISNKFLVSSTLIAYVAINTDTFQYWIINQNGEIIYKGQASNLKMAQANGRAMLKKFGAKILDEKRETSDGKDISTLGNEKSLREQAE